MAHDVLLYAREEREDIDVAVHLAVEACRLRVVGLQDVGIVEGEVDARVAEVGIVEGVEGVELLRALLRGSVASDHMAVEVDADLGYLWSAVRAVGRGQFEARHEVLLAVGAQLSDGQLRSREHDRLLQVFEEEGEGRGRIGHRVRAVEYHEAVILFVVLRYHVHHAHPVLRRHVGGVEWRVKLHGVHLRWQLVVFGYLLQQVREVERLQRPPSSGFCPCRWCHRYRPAAPSWFSLFQSP